MNSVAPFGISVSEAMLVNTTNLLTMLGFVADPDLSSEDSRLFRATDMATAGVPEITVTTALDLRDAPEPRRIVRLAVGDPLGVWCRWHLDGLAVAESDVDRFLHDPQSGVLMRCNDANRYELMPINSDPMRNRALFIDTDPALLTSAVTEYCRTFGFRPIIAQPFHEIAQMTLLQRGGSNRMTLGLLTPNDPPRRPLSATPIPTNPTNPTNPTKAIHR